MKKIEFETLREFEVLDLAMNKALKFLAFKSRTEKEMREFLYEKEFWKPVVEKTIQKMKNYNYINDEEYAKNFINERKNTKGFKMIAYELKHKGINENIIQEILSECDNQEEAIEKIAKKFIKNKQKSENINEKLFRHLASKGFDFEEVQSVCRRLLNEDRD